jgi:hypothetical protein
MATITRLITKRTRADAVSAQGVLEFLEDRADWSAGWVAEFPAAASKLRLCAQGAIEDAAGGISAVKDFTMVSTQHLPLAVSGIRRLPAEFRPSTAMAVFTLSLGYCEWNTGRLATTPKDMAEELGTTKAHVLTALEGLCRLGIFRKEIRLIPRPRRAPKEVPDFFVNPSISWRGDTRLRAAHVADPDPGHAVSTSRDADGKPYLAVVKP